MLKQLFLPILAALSLIACSQKAEEVVTRPAPQSLLHTAESTPVPQATVPQGVNAKPNDLISIIGVGDIMIAQLS
ncbi:MAG: hypothetical protein R3E08_05250 [Thiotrichaceae bacterium]